MVSRPLCQPHPPPWITSTARIALCPFCTFALRCSCWAWVGLHPAFGVFAHSLLPSLRAPSRITSRGTSSRGTNCATWQRRCHEASHTCMKMCRGVVVRATSLRLPTGTQLRSSPQPLHPRTCAAVAESACFLECACVCQQTWPSCVLELASFPGQCSCALCWAHEKVPTLLLWSASNSQTVVENPLYPQKVSTYLVSVGYVC